MNLTYLLSEVGTTATDGAAGTMGLLTMVIPIAAMIAVFYFLIIRPEKKRNKEMQDMLNNIQVADEVVTTGGIIGRVLSVKEDTVLIETGSDRTKIRVMKTSIAKNNTVHEVAEATPEVKKDKKGKSVIK